MSRKKRRAEAPSSPDPAAALDAAPLAQKPFGDLSERLRTAAPAGAGAAAPKPPTPPPVKKPILRRAELPAAPAPERERREEQLFSWWMRGAVPLEDTRQGRANKRDNERALLDRQSSAAKQRVLAGAPDDAHDAAFMDAMRAEDDPQRFAGAVDPLGVRTRLERSVRQEEERLFREAIERLDPETARAAGEERAAPERVVAAPAPARVDAELDLHGLTVDQALAQTAAWLSAGRRQGWRAARIITGKGLKSPQGGALREALRRWLDQNPLRLVRRWRVAPAREGGAGAFVVELKPEGK